MAVHWAVDAPQPHCGRRCKADLRAVNDAMPLAIGLPMGTSTQEFPAKSTVHYYFKQLCRVGTWAGIHDSLYLEIRNLESREVGPSYAIPDPALY